LIDSPADARRWAASACAGLIQSVGDCVVSGRIPEVDTYLQELEDPARREALAVLRDLIFEVVPNAVETMRYRMPTYEHQDEMLCAYASQKHYMSLYMDTSIVAEHGGGLAGLSIGKSCIRFRRLEDLPEDTIRVMLEETVARQVGP